MPSQKSLFAATDSTDSAVVHVPGTQGAAPLTKAQLTFNRLIERIERQREVLATWQDFLPKYQERFAQEMDPLQRRCDRAQLALAKVFDAAHDNAVTTKRERAKLRLLVLDVCTQLLAQGDAQDTDAEVIALHDKYSDASHAERKEEETGFLKDIAETVFGVELDEQMASSPEAIRDAMQRKLREQRASQRDPDAPRRKSAKALAKETKLAEAAQAATQSVREIYRKLASALHPDRETDGIERERKTDLMQQVNQAYAEKNLLRLLELQIQIEQIDAASLASMNPLRLGHYNQVLTEQCAQLEHEIDALLMPLMQAGSGLPRAGLTPQTLDRALDGDIAALRREAQRVEHELKRLSDRAALKAWLKHVKIERERDVESTYDELADAFRHTR